MGFIDLAAIALNIQNPERGGGGIYITQLAAEIRFMLGFRNADDLGNKMTVRQRRQ